MGKKRLLTGVIVGATVGGLISLLNEESRKYVKESLSQSFDTLQAYAQNPSQAVNKIRQSVLSLNNMIENNTSSAISALEQVESSLNKVMKK